MASKPVKNSLKSITPPSRQNEIFRRRLLRWYDAEKRDLPWRRTKDPYAILVSEFMLQQTQVSTVVPYYERFLNDFPTIERLARASEQEVLRAWAGLGYYSRARNLHAAALRIVEAYQGRIPDQFGDLLFLPGIGRYMAGAVASIAFGRAVPAVDTNVIRVLCRVYAMSVDPKSLAVRRDLEDIVLQTIARERPGDFNQALMDLGSEICTPRDPSCPQCPLEILCKAAREDQPENYPMVAKPPEAENVVEACAVIRARGHYFVRRCPAAIGRYRGMWEFPTLELAEGEDAKQKMIAFLRKQFHLAARVEEEWASIRHQVTHHKITKRVLICACGTPRNDGENPDTLWATLQELTNLPMGAPHKKIVDLLKESDSFFEPE